MVFLGLEKPVEQGREQVFDPVTAQMVLNANKDYINAVYNEYQQAKQDMKDFNKEYGDFLSPIQKDMDWYEKNVTGDVRNFINNLYAQGVDPLRSAEGRALVTRKLASMPTGDIAKVRQSAEAAKEYIKNRGALQAKGLWNPDYERAVLGGKSIEDWDTISGNSVWTRTSPSEYQDLNQYTSHIFDNLKDSYIDTRGAYDYYGVTENDLYKSLTPDKLGGLLNTDLGRFHYNNAIRDLAAQGNLNPTEAQKMEQFRKNIVAANHERVHEDRKINDIWKLQQEDASRMRAARASRPDTPSQENPVIGFTDRVKYAISQKQSSGESGAGAQKYNYKAVNNSILSSVLNNWSTKTVMPQGYDQEQGAKLLFYGYTERSPEAIDAITGRKSVRFTFVPNSGLHYTPLRMYDHNGMEVKGRIKSFDDYLHKNHVYGYPVDEPVSITNDVQRNSNIYDANGFLQVESNQIEGYFKQRYTTISGSIDYDSDSYKKFKKNQMKQLGLIENVQVTSKNYVDVEGKGAYVPESHTYYTIPVSRSAQIVGLGQSVIDTRVDKSIMSGKELGERERGYQNRDYNRKRQ